MDESHRKEPEQLSVFDTNDELLEYDRDQYRAGVRKARNTLFVAGGLMFVVDMFMLAVQVSKLNGAEINYTYLYGVIGLDIFLLGAFIALGLWTKRKPYTAILIGLVLFCAIQLFAMIGDPSNIYKGVVVKLVVIISLVSGLKKAKALQQMDRFAAGEF